MGSAVGGVSWAWSGGHVTRLTNQLKWQAIALSGQMGFTVQEILVVGRRETLQKDLLKAVRLVRGAPILAFDLEAAKGRVQALPWVGNASLERLLPDTILVRVEERRPLAIWQHKGRFALIDQAGRVILRKGLERYADLILVVGRDAPENAAALVKVLATQPQLLPMVKAAVRVGARRWDVRLRGAIDVRLPEEDPVSAWARLAEYERTHSILERDVKTLDLRQPDRLIVRRSSTGKGAKKPVVRPVTGRET